MPREEEGSASSDQNRTAAYRFGASLGLAGWPAGLDPARIWLGPARSRPTPPFPFSFSLLIQILIMCCALIRFKYVLVLRKL
jgi:hypothetical protein